MDKKINIKRKLYIISIIVAVFVITTSVGYGLFSKSLSIHGVATTLDYYSGTKLPHTPVDLNNRHSSYFSTDFNDEYTYLNSAAKQKDGYYYTFVDDSWTNDTYVVRFDKKMLGAFQGKTITYNVAFTNPTAIEYTDGTVTTSHGNLLSNGEVSIVSGTSSDVSSATATLSTATLAPSNQVTVSLAITLGIMNFNADTIVRARVGYRLYSGASGMRYFNFIIKYDSTIPNTSIVDDSDLVNDHGGKVIKVSNGYEVPVYPAIYYVNNTGQEKFAVDLKNNLQAGATYRIVRDYQGTVSSSAGLVAIRDSSAAIVKTPTNKGLRYSDFTLTQEQIDSITRVFVYGAGANYDSNLFTFIRIIKISD